MFFRGWRNVTGQTPSPKLPKDISQEKIVCESFLTDKFFWATFLFEKTIVAKIEKNSCVKPYPLNIQKNISHTVTNQFVSLP